MSVRTVVVVFLALVCGASAAIFSINLRPAANAAVETSPVVVAATDIPRGVSITADMLTVMELPKTSVQSAGWLTKTEEAIGRVPVNPISRNDFLSETKIAAKSAARGMAAIIPNGMRIVAIQTPSVASAGAGFIVPGNRVDVLLYVPDRSGASDFGKERVILQNIEIWAVGPRIEAPAENKVDTKELREVTLLVKPPEDLKLIRAQNLGTLHLALRNPEDKETRHVESVEPEQGPVADMPIQNIRTYHGTAESETRVQAPALKQPVAPPTPSK